MKPFSNNEVSSRQAELDTVHDTITTLDIGPSIDNQDHKFDKINEDNNWRKSIRTHQLLSQKKRKKDRLIVRQKLAVHVIRRACLHRVITLPKLYATKFI